MTLKEIIDIETRKNIEDLYKIHFINEGGWWRAYEWSALLCRNFPNGLENKDKLNITHRKTDKIDDGIILVGLQLQSFSKYFPKLDIPTIENGRIDIDVKDYFSQETFTIDNYKQHLTELKNSIPYKTDKEKSSVAKTENSVSDATIKSIMQEVIAYPLENKTLIDNTLFIRYLKDNLVKLI